VSGERGQAAVEFVLVATLVALLMAGGMDVLRVLRARDTAQRMAGQAAALTAEGRPLPAALRASVRVSGRRVTAGVRACAVTASVGCFTVRATAVLPEQR
jgi:Flp pilus assembly protein TadG